jgi:hypothetical protein
MLGPIRARIHSASVIHGSVLHARPRTIANGTKSRCACITAKMTALSHSWAIQGRPISRGDSAPSACGIVWVSRIRFPSQVSQYSSVPMPPGIQPDTPRQSDVRHTRMKLAVHIPSGDLPARERRSASPITLSHSSEACETRRVTERSYSLTDDGTPDKVARPARGKAKTSCTC